MGCQGKRIMKKYYMSLDNLAQTVLFHTKYLILTQTPQKAQNMYGAALVLAATPPTRMSVGCDEGNFSFPEECCLLLISARWYTQAIARVLAFPFGQRPKGSV